MPDHEQGVPRRRRRAVGPAGARPAEQPDAGLLELEVEPGGLEPPAGTPPDDERLRREVPPHHGS